MKVFAAILICAVAWSPAAVARGSHHRSAAPPKASMPPGAANASILGAGAPLNAVPSAVPTPSMPAPSAALATPAPSTPTLAPMSPLMSPPIAPNVFTGGSSGSNGNGASTPPRSDLYSSPNPGSASPSENAPSVAGGGGKTLRDCMTFWEPATHMSKTEWRDACRRSVEEVPSIIGPLKR